MTFEEVFKEIDLTKDKYRISNLLRELNNIEPNYIYLEKLKKLASHRTSEIRWASLDLLTKYVSPDLEAYFHELLKSGKDNITISKAIQGLSLNGTEKVIEDLILIFKKSRDGHVRGNIISSLRGIYLRNDISEKYKSKLYSFIGNDYPFFQGYWSEIKKAKIVNKTNWKEKALEQLNSNKLNLLFEQSNDIDFQIHIEKMNSHYIRGVGVLAIYKNKKSSFSKYYTPPEFYQSEGINFSDLFDKTKQMRPDNYKEKIIQVLEKELIPNVIDKINLWDELRTMPFSQFEKNQSSIFNALYGTTKDWIIAHLLTRSLDMFHENIDRGRFIDFIIQKWKDCNKETFSIINYLEEQKRQPVSK